MNLNFIHENIFEANSRVFREINEHFAVGKTPCPPATRGSRVIAVKIVEVKWK